MFVWWKVRLTLNVATLYLVGKIIGSFGSGWISASIGRKWVLFWSAFPLGLVWAFMGLSINPTMLYVASFGQGIFSAIPCASVGKLKPSGDHMHTIYVYIYIYRWREWVAIMTISTRRLHIWDYRKWSAEKAFFVPIFTILSWYYPLILPRILDWLEINLLCNGSHYCILINADSCVTRDTILACWKKSAWGSLVRNLTLQLKYHEWFQNFQKIFDALQRRR